MGKSLQMPVDWVWGGLVVEERGSRPCQRNAVGLAYAAYRVGSASGLVAVDFLLQDLREVVLCPVALVVSVRVVPYPLHFAKPPPLLGAVLPQWQAVSVPQFRYSRV
jgi:hypothetical protein